MTSLDDVLTASRVDEATDELTVPDGFGQGKATFGGLVVGACVRSMQGRVTDPRRTLRSISAQLIGAPKPGPTSIRVRLLRASGSVSTLVADLEQAGEVMTHVVGVFGAARPVSESWQTLVPPVAPPWGEVTALEMAGFAPEFTQHFEFRTVGAVPFTGSTEPSIGYIRPRVTCRVRDGAWLACMTDTWWLGCITRFEGPRPAATLTLNAELHASVEGLDPEAPLLHRGASHVLREGYSMETRELWGVDGRLLVTATELVTVIK